MLDLTGIVHGIRRDLILNQDNRKASLVRQHECAGQQTHPRCARSKFSAIFLFPQLQVVPPVHH